MRMTSARGGYLLVKVACTSPLSVYANEAVVPVSQPGSSGRSGRK
jgi:hypothetical protein